MAGRFVKWPLLVATAGATVTLLVAAGRFNPDGPVQVRSLSIHRAGTPNVGSKLLDLAKLALDEDRFADAERLSREALAIREQVLGPEHPALVPALRVLAASSYERDRFAEAEPPARRALAIVERHPGPPHSDRVKWLGLVANLSNSDGDRSEADAMSRRALAIAEEFPGFRRDTLIGALNSRGAFLARIEERPAEAVGFFERALALLEQDPETEPFALSLLLNNLGEIRCRLDQFPEAERLLLRSMAILDCKPDVPRDVRFDVVRKLGHFYGRQKRFADAEPFQRQALTLAEAIRGPDDPSLVEILLGLAQILAEPSPLPPVVEGQWRSADVEPLARRALAIAEKGFEPGSTRLADALAKAASILGNRGYSEEATALLNRALAIREAKLGPDSVAVADGLECLATILDQGDNQAQAEAPLRRALAIRERAATGPADPNIFEALKGLANLYVGQGRLAEAEPLARRIVAIVEAIEHPSGPQLAASLDFLGNIALKLGHLDDAESNLKRGLAILEANPGAEVEGKVSCLRGLSRLALARGRETEALDLSARADGLVPADATTTGTVFKLRGQETTTPDPKAEPVPSADGKFPRFPVDLGVKKTADPGP